MSRLIRIFTICLANLFFIPITEQGNKQGGCPNLAVCPNIPDFTLKRLLGSDINRGSYMGAHVLFSLSNELEKRDKMRGSPSILYLFRNEFNQFNNIRARMLDFFYHMTFRLLFSLISRVKTLQF